MQVWGHGREQVHGRVEACGRPLLEHKEQALGKRELGHDKEQAHGKRELGHDRGQAHGKRELVGYKELVGGKEPVHCMREDEPHRIWGEHKVQVSRVQVGLDYIQTGGSL